MFETIFYIIVMLLCLFGLTNLIWSVALWLMTARNCVKPFLVVPIGKTCNEIEATLRNALCRAQLLGSKHCAGVLAVDCGMDQDAQQACQAFCSCNDGVFLCKAEELQHLLASELTGKARSPRW